MFILNSPPFLYLDYIRRRCNERANDGGGALISILSSDPSPYPRQQDLCLQPTECNRAMNSNYAIPDIHQSHSSSSSGHELPSHNCASTPTDAHVNLRTPPLPLNILMVLQSDFDKPTRVDCGKSYELSIQFEIDTKTKHLLQDNLPGFLQYSFYDRQAGTLQVNAWVCFVSSKFKQSEFLKSP